MRVLVRAAGRVQVREEERAAASGREAGLQYPTSTPRPKRDYEDEQPATLQMPQPSSARPKVVGSRAGGRAARLRSKAPSCSSCWTTTGCRRARPAPPARQPWPCDSPSTPSAPTQHPPRPLFPVQMAALPTLRSAARTLARSASLSAGVRSAAPPVVVSAGRRALSRSPSRPSDALFVVRPSFLLAEGHSSGTPGAAALTCASLRPGSTATPTTTTPR